MFLWKWVINILILLFKEISSCFWHNFAGSDTVSNHHLPPGRVAQIALFTFCLSWYFKLYHDESFEVVAHFIVPPCSSLCVEWYLVLWTYICMSHVSDFIKCHIFTATNFGCGNILFRQMGPILWYGGHLYY